MKRIIMKLFFVAALLAASCWRAEASGTWTPLVNPAPTAFSNCLLLSDGTLICADGGSAWYRLTPDSHGSYVNGTWSQIASMNDTRLFYSAQVLTDGRVYVAGGEYGTGHGTSETYNPLTNVWTHTAPSPFSVFSDAISALLPNGNVLQSDSQSSAAIYNPTTDTWSLAAAPGDQNEADWVKLPDDSLLTIIAYGRNAQRYIPSQNTWVSEPPVPVDMYNSQGELGSAHLLPNGKVFWLGATSNTVIYTPTGNTNPGSWVAGPVIPNGYGANDAPAAMMANGKILCAFADSTTSFGTKTFFYEYDYTTNTFTQIPDPNHTADLSDPIVAYDTSMIDLPDGSVFYCGADSKSYIYTPDGTQLTAGIPVIASVTKNADGSYHLIGTGLTGLSEGAKFGDDKQMNTNYPIVHLTDNATDNVYYARTYNWTSTGVMTGGTVIATEFTLPAGLPQDPYSLVVSANGLVSAPVAFPPTAAMPAFSPGGGTYTSAQTVTITSATSGASIRYTTDGSTPSETNGTLYSGPVSISTTTTLQALAYESGYADSAVTIGNYTISYTISSSNGFDNIPMSSSQSGTFTATFDASPSLSPSNAVIGLSKGTQTAYTGLSCIARFNTSGDIDAYNGTAYQAASVIPYSKALTYHFRMVVNAPANTYSVYVTPPGGSELTVGLNYKFRKAATSLDTWTIDVNATPGGSVTVSNLAVGSGLQQVSPPSFSPGAGTYSSAPTVIINDATSGASIRYTTDGVTTPTETVGTLYTGSISISTTTKLEAIAYKAGMTDSTVTTGMYTIIPPPSAPVFSPGAGTYTSAPTVTITSSGATSIYYTTNGSTPTSSSTRYVGPIPVSTSLTLEAIGTNSSGPSPVTTGQYTLQVVAPTFSPPPGLYAGSVSVMITSATSGASIAYTTDGTTPTEVGGTVTHGTLLSNGAFVSISPTCTLSAMAFESGKTDSSVTTGSYVLGTQVSAPAFSPPAGGYQSAQSVAITSATNGASIAYTTDGTTPTENGGTVTHGTSLANGGVVTISSTTTLNAIAYQAGMVDSTVTNGNYAITPVIVRCYFNAANNGGIFPEAAPVQGSDGNFYGTTNLGGSANEGTVYKMTPAGVLTTLVSFSGANGSYPYAGVVQGTDGNFYGTTDTGGSASDGTVFKVTPTGVLTTLVSFTGANGSNPTGALVQGSDGNFYGTTSSGGSGTYGTVFMMTPTGALTTLVSFTGPNGASPTAALIQGSDGNFYSTTMGDAQGGGYGFGTVFKMTPAGALTTLVSFDNTTDGLYPVAALVQGSDGNFYGMTEGDGNGGTFSNGTVFKMTPAGALTNLVTFTGSNGSNPLGALVQGSDGNFYGTTANGGSAIYGTVFKMTPAGVLTTVDTFYGGNGSNPNGLVQGSDGNFYGTAASGGTFNDGVVFEVPKVLAPIFTPSAGTYTSAQSVTIASATGGASIAYTTDGSTPTENGGTVTHGTLLSNGGFVNISVTTTLKALAFKTGLIDSPVTTGTYTITQPPSAPVFSPGAGTYTSAPTVTITSAGATAIYYTTNGSTPTSSSTPYTGPIVISTSLTLKAIGTNSSGPSPVTTGQYTIQVAPPVFSPGPGTYTSAQSVTITSTTSGASIAYTTDGSTPTESGGSVTHGTLLANGGSVFISVTTTLKAMAFKTGMTDSTVTTGQYTITSGRSLTGTSSDGWHALALTSAQTGTFTATFDATPSASPENAVVGLSKGVATAYTGLSCIARFNTSGDIDAYNGTAYQAASIIPYAKNTAYHFRMVVNVPAHTYSVYVTPAGGTELTVGLNYVFRVTQASLDTWNLDVNGSPSGCSLTANNLNP